MNAIHLAQAVHAWLRYQSLCGRSELFCEAYLSQPIGEYMLSLKPEDFQPEFPFPNTYQAGARRRRSLDFAVFGPPHAGQQKVLMHAIETKFITARRIFTQEAYDDLYRLLWFQPTREPAQCSRWFVVAGYKRNIDGEKFLGARVQLKPGKGQVRRHAFRGLLSTDLNNHTRTKPVHAANPELRKLWVEAADGFGQQELPDQITVRLAGRAPANPKPTDLCCYVWKVERPQPAFGSIYPC